ncbi:MAG: HPr(Ser) kinase/phosphatase [Defluviitaleaceae bacterium]|nr:HPr(Ser) kinase/phosphatase [Defluviitaleaceae bacterium]
MNNNKLGTVNILQVSVQKMVQELSLASFTPDVDMSKKMLSRTMVHRPGLQLAGFYEYFDSERIQIIGRSEYGYLNSVSEKERKDKILRLFENPLPCVVICHDFKPFTEMLDVARNNSIPLLSCKENTTEFAGDVIRWLKFNLAPKTTVHGVFVDIFGIGVLILGESGIGKSEMALELIKRGHRLVADDAVEIRRVSSAQLIGTSPENIRSFIEVRGIGIMDVTKMYGVQSVKESQNVELVLKLDIWEHDKPYDRLGDGYEYIEILGNKVVCQTLPVRPGRNLAMIGESAAVYHRQKMMGYSPLQALNERVNSSAKEG